MGFFTTILEKLGFDSGVGEAQAATSSEVQAGAAAMGPAGAVPVVDVMAKLEGLAQVNPQKLNWKESIVDLLKLLGLESSFAARKELAQELGCPADKMDDSASMNVWLHKAVLRKLADNGGNIPSELL